MKSIYTHYKERLIEISGKNRSVYTRSFSKKMGYDVGKVLEKDLPRQVEFTKFLWSGKRESFTLLDSNIPSLRRFLGAEALSERLYGELSTQMLSKEDEKSERARIEKRIKLTMTASLEKELGDLRVLQREAEDVEKETGRYELFIGYPFVYGTVRDVVVKAPLLFFPCVVEITGSSATLTLKRNESVRLNKALVFAYAQAKNLNTEELVTEFDASNMPKDIPTLLDYLKGFGIKIQPPAHKYIYNFKKFTEPKPHDAPAVMRACVLARYSLANSIYNDYTELEKKKLTNTAIEELLHPGKPGKPFTPVPSKNHYFIGDIDYAQRAVVEKVASAGNMVIYGPPGTGKSQTIVNIISDALCKGKKVLVVSQKKAALDVVYNRLGELNEKAMFLVDPIKERRAFYDRCLTAHNKALGLEESALLTQRHDEVSELINAEKDKLEQISSALSVKGEFGLSLIDMYYLSYAPTQSDEDIKIYKGLLASKELMSADYASLLEVIDGALGGKMETYYRYVEAKKRNPFVAHLKGELPLGMLSSARSKLDKLLSQRNSVFDAGEYPYARQILSHYDDLTDKTGDKLLVRMLTACAHPARYKFLQVSRFLFPLFPFAKLAMSSAERKLGKTYYATKTEVGNFVKEYAFLREVLTDAGYAMAMSAVLEGNEAALDNLRSALADYVKLSDLHASVGKLTKLELACLKLAYSLSNSHEGCFDALNKLLPLRIYHEIAKYEDTMKSELSLTVDFESIRTRINSLLAEQKELAKKICAQSFINEYKTLYQNGRNGKDYLYQISKKQSFWPVRRTMDVYGDYLLNLFPCWLLSPENVSTVLPLRKNIFDLVLFDEASQVFIENTLPSIVRGKNIVVAGDAKQLRPTATFMRRYMGGEEEEDASTQAALEVESLLDLAVARFDSANITYHYRSASRELIDFSNKAFYDGKLRISPNVSKSVRSKPIVRIMVDGKWENRRNVTEAQEVVALIRKLLRSGKGHTIGVITFGSEQQNCIEDLLDKECRTDAEFRALYAKESSRKEDGQDVGLFVKNIENVQGDERDIIIFCVGYAVGENGKVNAHFGSLSADGGENRLNVAITRAKKKIYVVTSIEPEELRVDNSKNDGPKLFKVYLSYVRAVAGGKKKEAETILSALCPASDTPLRSAVVPVEQQIADKLEELGYHTETNLGEGSNRISVAVYDKRADRYALGIQLDRALIASTEDALERDVFSSRFLTGHGWKIMRVWSRDWWHNPKGVIEAILKELEA